MISLVNFNAQENCVLRKNNNEKKKYSLSESWLITLRKYLWQHQNLYNESLLNELKRKIIINVFTGKFWKQPKFDAFFYQNFQLFCNNRKEFKRF